MKEKHIMKIKFWNVVIYSIILFGALFEFFPMIWLVVFSLGKDTDMFATEILKIPDPIQWGNYISAWVDGKMAQYMFNNIVVTISTITLVVLFSLMLGYAFSRIKWKGSKIIFGIIILGMMIPIHATIIPNYFVFKALKLTDSYLGLIIPYTAFNLTVATFIMTGFMKSIPASLEESAIIDGCGVYRIIFNIVFPLLKPAIITVVILTFISSWNEFIMAYTFISKSYMRTLPFSVYEFAGRFTSSYAKQFAVMAIASVPTITLYILLNEQITKGITMGALK
jgi:raffinose/stachyose/melibiose transport system permease protein